MVEHVVGDAMVAAQKLRGAYSPFLGWTEMGLLRKGKHEESEVLKRGKKVTLGQRRREVISLVKDQKVVIEHFDKGTTEFAELGKDVLYELSVMASVLQEIQKGDLMIGQQAIAKDAKESLLKLKRKVRAVSDMWGSVANNL
jgi:uncharacterized protein YktB (UPF0637 family)